MIHDLAAFESFLNCLKLLTRANQVPFSIISAALLTCILLCIFCHKIKSFKHKLLSLSLQTEGGTGRTHRFITREQTVD